MKQKIAFIGIGNMAGAIIGALSQSSGICPSDIIFFDKNPDQYERFAEGYIRADSITDAVSAADCVFLCVKPQNMREVLSEIPSVCCGSTLFVSIAAGITIDTITSYLGEHTPIIRVMPNTPLLIGSGVTALCRNEAVTEEDYAFTRDLFAVSGNVFDAKEKDINAITALTASSPAYVYLFIKAMADSGRALGIEATDEELIKMAANAVIGSAKMLLSSDKSPDELIRMVTSPNGTTEKAMAVFYKRDFTGIVNEAMQDCTKRAEELSKEA